MTRVAVICFALLSLSAHGTAWSWLHSQLWDARFAGEFICAHTNCTPPGLVQFELPTGEYEEMTVCFWVRMESPTGASLIDYQQTTACWVCPEPIQRSGPDLLAGGCGFDNGGTNLAGTASWDVALTGYDEISNYPDGVYTVAGTSDAELTVTVGGEDINVGPGDFNINVVAGPADSIQVSGTAECEVGVARCHLHKFHGFMDGVVGDNSLFTNDSIITNELKFVSYRIRLENGYMIYKSDMSTIELSDQISQLQSNALAAGVSRMSSRGHYSIGVNGLGLPINEPGVLLEMWDVRFFPWWLSDEQLTRIHGNGAEEIERRGISRWK